MMPAFLRGIHPAIYDHYALYKSYDKVRAYCPEWKPEYLICGHESAHLYGEL